MRKQAPHPHQTAFGLELDALFLPTVECGNDLVKEPTALTVSVLEFVPVYTVTVRRADVVTLQNRAVIRSPSDAAALVWACLKEADRENFLVLLLDTKNQVIGINTVSVGILDSALVHPREVFKAAIIANSTAILLAHNHPSGDPTPSLEDRRVTQRLQEAGQNLGIEVMDHIILGEREQFVSLKERGLFRAEACASIPPGPVSFRQQDRSLQFRWNGRG